MISHLPFNQRELNHETRTKGKTQRELSMGAGGVGTLPGSRVGREVVKQYLRMCTKT